MSLTRLIPGYGAALADEARVRGAPFVPAAPRLLCGVEVRALTLRDHERLVYIRSPFVCGGAAEREHIAQLLWFQRHDAGSPESEPGFAARFDALDVVGMCAAIGEFLDEFLMDAPKGGGGSAPTVGMAASMIHRLRLAYVGMTRDEVLDMDLRELWQYVRCARRDAEPGAVFFNALSDPLKSEFARKLSEEAAAAATRQPD